jgi:hypothetical protein
MFGSDDHGTYESGMTGSTQGLFDDDQGAYESGVAEGERGLFED